MKNKYADHEATHFLLSMVLYEMTGHWIWLVLAGVNVVLIVVAMYMRYLDRKLERLP